MHRWGMDSGNWSGSRFGLKGCEELGNGLTVGFVLENGFAADTGALKSGNRLFDREATVSLSGGFGTLYAGRMGTLVSDAGSVGFYAGAVSPFGSGIGEIAGHYAVTVHPAVRYDNTLTYVTPTIGGFTGYLQYAMGDTAENTAANDRYAALGASYANGPLSLAFVADRLNRNTSSTLEFSDVQVPVGSAVGNMLQKEIKDTYTLNLGGSYDFGAVKLFAAGQYFKDAGDPGNALTGLTGTLNVFEQELIDQMLAVFPAGADFDGYGANLGVSAPLAGGTAMLSAGYMKADTDVYLEDVDLKAETVLAGYVYDLSKRTSLYAAAGMTRQTFRMTFDDVPLKQKNTVVQAAAGLVHRF